MPENLHDFLDDDAADWVQIDPSRSWAVTKVKDGLSLVLLLEDPHAISIVELTCTEAQELARVLLERSGG